MPLSGRSDAQRSPYENFFFKPHTGYRFLQVGTVKLLRISTLPFLHDPDSAVRGLQSLVPPEHEGIRRESHEYGFVEIG